MKKDINPWDFVVANYPDYYGSSEIARNNDLACIADGEYEYSENDQSDKADLYRDIAEEIGVFDADGVQLKAYDLLQQSNALIYEKAITAYMLNNNIDYNV